MAKEYIEREQAIRKIKWASCEEEAVMGVRRIPAADVVEVKHGVWIPYEDESWVCSECGTENCYAYNVNLGKFEDIYCPCCGVKMDGERREK